MHDDTPRDRPRVAMGAAVTLGDVLAPPELELKLICGGDDALATTVRGAHFSEILDPQIWLEEQWIMMTSGVEMYRDPTRQRKLVRDLVAMNASALGYCTGIKTKAVPPALLDESAKLGLPLFDVPYHVPIRHVMTHVHRLVLGTDDVLLQRAIALTDYLLTGFDGPMPPSLVPETRIVASLRRMLGLRVDHVDVQGLPVDPDDAGAVELSSVINGVSDQGSTHVRVHGEDVLAVPCRVGARLTGWLVVHLPPSTDGHRYVLAAAEAAAMLIAVASLARQRNTDNLEALGQHLMAHLLRRPARRPRTGVGDLNALGGSPTMAVLRELGFTTTDPIRAIVADELDPAARRPEDLARVLRSAGVPYAWAVENDTLVVAVQCSSEVALALTERFGVQAGVGGPVDPQDLTTSVRQAQFALRMLRSDHRRARPGSAPRPESLDFAQLPPAALAAEQIGDVIGEEAVEEFLAPLLEQPLLLEAVVEFLRCDQDVATAAQRLHLHPNSLRYRLDRAAAALGAPIRRPSTLASLYLACAASNLL